MPHGIGVYIKGHEYYDHVGKLYYSCGFELICIHCSEYLPNEIEMKIATHTHNAINVGIKIK